MSEYQYVAFRAMDRAVAARRNWRTCASSLRVLKSRRGRSKMSITTATSTATLPRCCCRGYDIHLHYANFGMRSLLIRLPDGLPDPRAAKLYLAGDSLRFLKIQRTRGHAGD